MRELILKALFRMFPFSLDGDCDVPAASNEVEVSCIINFFGRLDLLEGTLYSLSAQKYPRNLFEVVLVEDQGGTPEGRAAVEYFGQLLPIVHLQLPKLYGRMGHVRNFGLNHSKGKIVLFLDDDTVTLQEDFLSRLEELFSQNPQMNAIVPHGQAGYSLIKGRYSYHDPYFMSSSCTAYRRQTLHQLSGFVDNFIGQEDVEFVIRFILAGKKSLLVPNLDYYHPPLQVSSLKKPMAVGWSFFNLKKMHSLLLWLLIPLKCTRQAPLWILPGRKNKEKVRFGISFLLGAITAPLRASNLSYS